MPPKYVSSLEDYWVWLDRLVDQSGGGLSGNALIVRPVEIEMNVWEGLVVEDQRLYFHDGTFLDFHMILDENLSAMNTPFTTRGPAKN